MHALVDFDNLFARAYFAYRDDSKWFGLYGTINMLLSFIKYQKPHRIHICCDSYTYYRRTYYPQYKKNRADKPDDYEPQKSKTRDVLTKIGLSVYREPGFEADDIIAKLCSLIPGFKVIVSSDKDLLQLVQQEVYQIRPQKSYDVLTPSDVFSEYKFEAKYIADYLALVGDSVDNIPGCKQIGPKRATKLIQSFGSLENVYAQIEKVDPNIKKFLIAGKREAFMSKELTTLALDMNLELKSGEYDKNKIYNYVKGI